MLRFLSPLLISATLLPTISIPGAGQPPASGQRIVAIGDIHGALAPLTELLQSAGLIAGDGSWAGGTTHLIQTGDCLDRGEHVREVLDLLVRLEREAPKAGGRVEMLLGNHEVMNLLHDFRDVSPAIYSSFADEKSEERRGRAYEEYVRVMRRWTAEDRIVGREQWMASRPPGFLEYVEAVGPSGTYGRWLRSRPVALKLDGTIFMHAGLSPGWPGDLDEVNRTAARDLLAFDEAWERLETAGLIGSFFTLNEMADVTLPEMKRIVEALSQGKPAGNHVTRELFEALQVVNSVGRSSLLALDGPLWFRGLATLPAAEEPGIVAQLERLDARRFVSAHTPSSDGRITSRYNGRVFLIDTGMLSSYYKGGQASALEFLDGRITAIYAQSREVLVPAPGGF